MKERSIQLTILITILICNNSFGQDQTTNFNSVFKYNGFHKGIEVGISDSTFYYKSFQDIRYHFTCGTYIKINNQHLQFKIDTIKTLKKIKELNNDYEGKRFVFTPQFNDIDFIIQGDTLKCIYKNGREKIYNAIAEQ